MNGNILSTCILYGGKPWQFCRKPPNLKSPNIVSCTIDSTMTCLPNLKFPTIILWYIYKCLIRYEHLFTILFITSENLQHYKYTKDMVTSTNLVKQFTKATENIPIMIVVHVSLDNIGGCYYKKVIR